MSEYDEPEIIRMIDDCENREEKMTAWELSFVASVSIYPGKGWTLTKLQQSRLTEIWERVTI